MEPRSLKFIAAACDGATRGGTDKARASRVCIDSRQAHPGDLFFALTGERFDGHDFLHEAARKGAVAVVVSRSRAPKALPGCSIIAVDDARQALRKLAARYREDFALPVVAIGGSNGKTTVKELIAAVLRQKMATLWSEASFNNNIGVPLTLLRLDGKHEAAVLEVGTNHPGELAPLVRTVRPNLGVITNIGREHLEFFGDMAGVVEEEGSLAELLPADGKLLVNGDSEWTEPIIKRSRACIVRVGLSSANAWRARDLRVGRDGVTFQVDAPKTEYDGEYGINLLGRHQVVNALFAIAVGVELGLDRAAIQRGLAECVATRGRLQLWEANGVWVLDDAYNANADSMAVALQTLKELPCEGRRVAVLGDMAELGAHSVDAHEEVGRRAAELGVEQLFAVGKMAGVMARTARAAGLTRIFEFADVQTTANAVKRFAKAGDLVLLKASRVTGLERVGEALRVREARISECFTT